MTTMRLVSYNCQALSAGAQSVVETLQRLAPDVVALQEVDQHTRRSGAVNQTALLAQALALDGVFSAAMPYDGGEYGLAVLARGEVTLAERLVLPRHGAEEPRIAMLTLIRGAGHDLWLVNTHLAADYQAERPQALRLEQARALAQWLQRVRSRIVKPLLLVGDLNCEPGSEPYAVLASVAQPLHGPLLTYPSPQPREAIDHIFCVGEPALQAEAVFSDASEASDHRPLVVDVK